MSRPLCPRCRLPRSTCLCRWVRPTDNDLPLLVLQHPAEARQAKGSVRLLTLSLRRCRCEVGDDFAPDQLAAWLGDDGDSLLLFPAAPLDARAPDVDSVTTALPRPKQLVLLDGTWRQAGGLLRNHAALQALPRWAVTAPPPSRYAIRRAPRPQQQRSTLEAACLALGALEGRPAHYDPLLSAFSAWVAEVAGRAGR